VAAIRATSRFDHNGPFCGKCFDFLQPLSHGRGLLDEFFVIPRNLEHIVASPECFRFCVDDQNAILSDRLEPGDYAFSQHPWPPYI
jgi:hypothetical protein